MEQLTQQPRQGAHLGVNIWHLHANTELYYTENNFLIYFHIRNAFPIYHENLTKTIWVYTINTPLQSWLLLMPCKIDPIKRSVRNSCEHCCYEGPERAGRGTWWCHQCCGQWCDRGDEESGRWTFGILQCSDISHFSIVQTFWDKRSQRSVQTLSLCMASKELTSERWSSR